MDLSIDLSIAFPEWVMVGIRNIDIHAFLLDQFKTSSSHNHERYERKKR